MQGSPRSVGRPSCALAAMSEGLKLWGSSTQAQPLCVAKAGRRAKYSDPRGQRRAERLSLEDEKASEKRMALDYFFLKYSAGTPTGVVVSGGLDR
jgi:hypothetical protein